MDLLDRWGSTSPVFIGALLLVVLTLGLVVHGGLSSPLAKIPAGHVTAHFSYLWILCIRWQDREHPTLLRLHRKYGPILRLGPNEISVNSREGLHKIYTRGFPIDPSYVRRYSFYRTPNLFSTTSSTDHSQRRRGVQRVFAKQTVVDCPSRRETMRILLGRRLLPLLDKDYPLDVCAVSEAFCMDAFTSYQFGLSSGTNFLSDLAAWARYLDQFFCSRRRYLFLENEVPALLPLLARLGIGFPTRQINAATAELERWNLRMCDQAELLLSGQDDVDAVNQPIVYRQQREATRPGLPGNTRQFEVASNMLDYTIAVHEDSGAILTECHRRLAEDPALQVLLHRELMTLNPPVVYSAGLDQLELPSFDQVDALSLLDALIVETLRLRVPPPHVRLQPRLTPSPSCTLSGHPLPPGVHVQCDPYVFHRDLEVYPEPEAWKPDRWREPDPEKLKRMRASFWPFGRGERVCIGQHVAIHFIKLALAAIYTNYRSVVSNAHGYSGTASTFPGKRTPPVSFVRWDAGEALTHVIAS
ncbi:uncharacterized protein A1O9_13003 [Exophiala aquamarina CBS 119918]|uniref:Cytochrome P450 oxidoreductase n=1 Tax=Exophiala aquamarina CBS 119918 TaxID=1182545 RepID=A0A072NTH2_9EURO|nr:uncharacterized protein A1O9_13003 [Exophiala aquamarina CBS 119918]KEF50941.1 hypothetical protein A1O9_13003 [Exophiala aquamarina CBS 119918]